MAKLLLLIGGPDGPWTRVARVRPVSGQAGELGTSAAGGAVDVTGTPPSRHRPRGAAAWAGRPTTAASTTVRLTGGRGAGGGRDGGHVGRRAGRRRVGRDGDGDRGGDGGRGARSPARRHCVRGASRTTVAPWTGRAALRRHDDAGHVPAGHVQRRHVGRGPYRRDGAGDGLQDVDHGLQHPDDRSEGADQRCERLAQRCERGAQRCDDGVQRVDRAARRRRRPGPRCRAPGRPGRRREPPTRRHLDHRSDGRGDRSDDGRDAAQRPRTPPARTGRDRPGHHRLDGREHRGHHGRDHPRTRPAPRVRPPASDHAATGAPVTTSGRGGESSARADGAARTAWTRTTSTRAARASRPRRSHVPAPAVSCFSDVIVKPPKALRFCRPYEGLVRCGNWSRRRHLSGLTGVRRPRGPPESPPRRRSRLRSRRAPRARRPAPAGPRGTGRRGARTTAARPRAPR